MTSRQCAASWAHDAVTSPSSGHSPADALPAMHHFGRLFIGCELLQISSAAIQNGHILHVLDLECCLSHDMFSLHVLYETRTVRARSLFVGLEAVFMRNMTYVI